MGVSFNEKVTVYTFLHFFFTNSSLHLCNDIFLQFGKKFNIQATRDALENPLTGWSEIHVPGVPTVLWSNAAIYWAALEHHRFFNKSLLSGPRRQSDVDTPSLGSSSPNSSSSSCLLFSVSWFSSVPLDFVSKPLLDTVRSLIFGSFFRSPVHSLQNKVFYQR